METKSLDKDWYSLFGKDIKSPELQEILSYSSSETFDYKVFNDKEGKHEYYFNYSLGISLSFNNGIFSSVFLYGKYDKKFKAFPGKLPYFLNFDMVNADVVSFLGEPNQKNGGRTVPISISYDKLGIEFTFLLPIWDITDNKLGFVCLFPKVNNTENKVNICALCRKDAGSVCSQCKLVSYCSRTCQTTHWKVHKNHCNQYFKSTNPTLKDTK